MDLKNFKRVGLDPEDVAYRFNLLWKNLSRNPENAISEDVALGIVVKSMLVQKKRIFWEKFSIPLKIDSLAEKIRLATQKFIKTKSGQMFLNLSLLGPLTFMPTIWKAWAGGDIDALRTQTWPLLLAVNISALVAVCHNGDWRLRLSSILWIIFVLMVWLATLVR